MSNKPHILVVDDEEIVRLNIERILEEEYSVKSAASGEEALILIKKEDFDLVLTDLVMKGMNGLTLLDEIKRLLPEMIVIIVTGYGSLPSAIAAMQRGAYDYILKPCSREELLIRVKKGIEKGDADKRLLQVKKMETLLANIGIFLINEQGIIISGNPVLQMRIWGDLPVIGQKFSELPYIGETEMAKNFESILKGKPGETIEQEEIKIPQPDSGELIISCQLKPAVVKNGQAKSLIFLVEDITRRVRIMRQISQTEKLTALGKLAAGVAHEINNPLNIISLDVEYVKSQLEPDNPLQENLHSISEEVDRIARIVQQLQEQTRTQESIHEGSDLKKILSNHIFQIVFSQLNKKKIKVKLNLEENQGEILIPRSKLTQVLMNLLKNAEDAMPCGGTLSLSSATIPAPPQGEGERKIIGAKPNQLAYIALSDTGSGIKREHLPYIFEPFFTTKGFEGTGLGLFISYTIIKGYHGNLDLQTKENEGSTFIITLPLTETKESMRAV
ncbi:MAG: response regulator [Candidatus Schekmanbacteria bacterium]|nr:response regulator [Candidatus Schekmanbacteria bacterium]